jgi:hypothetical protein
LKFGGETSSFPALKRNVATIDFRLADDSDFANVRAMQYGAQTTGIGYYFGGGTSAYPGLKRSTTEIQARLADDSAYATFSGNLSVPGTAILAASGAASTTPNKVGTARPGSCTTGQTFFDSDETAGQNVYGCTSTDTWTLQGDGAGGGSGTVNSGTASYLTYYASTGTAVSELPRIRFDDPSEEIDIYDASNNNVATLDLATGFWTQGKLVTTGHAEILGGAGDTGASSSTIYGGDAASNAEPAYVGLLQSATGEDVYAYPCDSDGRVCLSTTTPAADSADWVKTALNDRGSDAGASDTYAVTTSPSFSAYTTGVTYCFYANTANTDGATVNFNSLGALPMLKKRDTALVTGDIEAAQWICGIYDGTNYQITSQLAQDPSGADLTNVKRGAVAFTLDGGGSAITTGAKTWVRVAYSGTITGHEFTCDQTGSIVLDLWNDSYANFPPTVADTITASAKPTLSAAQKAQDNTLTGWTTAISVGDYIRLNVDSASTVTHCVLSLQVTKD